MIGISQTVPFLAIMYYRYCDHTDDDRRQITEFLEKLKLRASVKINLEFCKIIVFSKYLVTISGSVAAEPPRKNFEHFEPFCTFLKQNCINSICLEDKP